MQKAALVTWQEKEREGIVNFGGKKPPVTEKKIASDHNLKKKGQSPNQRKKKSGHL